MSEYDKSLAMEQMMRDARARSRAEDQARAERESVLSPEELAIYAGLVSVPTQPTPRTLNRDLRVYYAILGLGSAVWLGSFATLVYLWNPNVGPPMTLSLVWLALVILLSRQMIRAQRKIIAEHIKARDEAITAYLDEIELGPRLADAQERARNRYVDDAFPRKPSSSRRYDPGPYRLRNGSGR